MCEVVQNENPPSDEGAADDDTVHDEQLVQAKEGVVGLSEALHPLGEHYRQSVQPHLEALLRSTAAALGPRFANVNREIVRHLNEAWRPAISGALKQMMPVMANLQAWVEEKLPPNWQGANIQYKKVEEIVSSDSIPLVWVPRAEIVSEIMRVDTRDERVAILLERRAEIAEDCLAALDGIHREDLLGRAEFGRKAIAASRTGHFEAAQVLAACVTESLVSAHLGKPSNAATYATIDWRELSIGRLRWAASVAPLLNFYEQWRPEWGRPPLKTLSRHNSVHHPSAEQCTPENCTIAVMLLCSLLRTLQEEFDARERAAERDGR